jgi:hypothetical protein
MPLKFHVGERLTVPVPDGEAGLLLLDRPRRREAARSRVADRSVPGGHCVAQGVRSNGCRFRLVAGK